jgi:hypothetical protein
VTPLYPQKLALTSPTGGGRSVGIVRSRTKATEFSFSFSCGTDRHTDVFCYIDSVPTSQRTGFSPIRRIHQLVNAVYGINECYCKSHAELKYSTWTK